MVKNDKKASPDVVDRMTQVSWIHALNLTVDFF